MKPFCLKSDLFPVNLHPNGTKHPEGDRNCADQKCGGKKSHLVLDVQGQWQLFSGRDFLQDLLDADLVDKILELRKLVDAPEKNKDHQKGKYAFVHDPPGVGRVLPEKDPAQINKKAKDEYGVGQPVLIRHPKVVDGIQKGNGHQCGQEPPGGLGEQSGAKGNRIGISHPDFL